MAVQVLTLKKPFYSTGEVGRRWGKDRLTIITAIRNGKLHAVRLTNRGRYMIPAAEIARLEAGEVRP